MGLKSVLFFPLDTIDHQCGETTVEKQTPEPEEEDESVEVNEDTFPNAFSSSQGDEVTGVEVSVAEKQEAPSVRRRRRRIFRI